MSTSNWFDPLVARSKSPRSTGSRLRGATGHDTLFVEEAHGRRLKASREKPKRVALYAWGTRHMSRTDSRRASGTFTNTSYGEAYGVALSDVHAERPPGSRRIRCDVRQVLAALGARGSGIARSRMGVARGGWLDPARPLRALPCVYRLPAERRQGCGAGDEESEAAVVYGDHRLHAYRRRAALHAMSRMSAKAPRIPETLIAGPDTLGPA